MAWVLIFVAIAGLAIWAMQASKRPAVNAPQGGPAPRQIKSASAVLRVKAGASFPREVVGESRYHETLLEICGGYRRDGHFHECDAVLRPEPDNAYDANAVQVLIEGRLVGYLARDDAERYTRELAAAGHAGCETSVAARIKGGARTNQHNAQNFGVYLAFTWPAKFEGRR